MKNLIVANWKMNPNSQKEAKDISINDYLITPLLPFSQKVITNLEMAYLLGLCAADGCISRSSSVYFCFSNKDSHSKKIDFLATMALDGKASIRRENVKNSNVPGIFDDNPNIETVILT